MTASPPVQTPERLPRNIRPLDRIAALIVYLLSFGFIYSFMESSSVNMWLALILLLLALPFYLRRFSIRFNAAAWVLYTLLPLFTLPQILYDAPHIRLLSMTTVLLGFLYVVHYLCAGYGKSRLPGEAILLDGGKAVFGMPFSQFGAAFDTIARGKDKRFGRMIGLIIAGLALALIPTLVVTVLLISADDSFADLLGDILSALPGIHLPVVFVSLLFAIPLCCYVYGHIWACGTHSLGGGVSEMTYRNSITVCRIVPVPMACAAIFPLLLIYLLFFSTQIPYFIGGFTGALPDGLTYAAYARQGFFELCTVAVINAGMQFCLNLFTRRESDRLPMVPRIMSLLLSLFTLILLSTATAKMLLYIDTYGLSRKRVYTLWLMALLAVYFIIQILRQCMPRLRSTALIFAVVVLFIGIFLFVDFDRIIANYNVDAYLSGQTEQIDTDALGDLSASAVPALLRLYDEADNKTVQRDAAREIAFFLKSVEGSTAAQEEYGRYGGKHFSFSLARALTQVRSHPAYADGKGFSYTSEAAIINPNH